MTNANCTPEEGTLPPGSVTEYIAALKQSEKFSQVIAAHRREPATEADTVPLNALPPPLRQLVSALGIQGLYRHQLEAITHIQAGHNTVVATPTASGKSLIYTLPIVQSLMAAPATRALCLFPLKALAQDQLKTLEQMRPQLPEPLASTLRALIYDGDTSAYFRKKIREYPPAILITNPDMLHLSLLPYHHQWAHFFAGLKYVVIDEMHTYRGVFGSHVAWVLRRLKRICTLYGADPVFIMASATIGNPAGHAQRLVGAPVQLVDRSGAPRAARNTILINPLDSAATSATLLLEAAIRRQLRTIVYCQSRKMTELITIWTEQRLRGRNGCLASYRAGFLPEERRSIEARLAEGSLLGVITTSALELGIDIGNLDICLLVGYPGSIIATWQRAGRVGRKQQEALVVLLGHEDALDQHFMRNPDDLFDRPVEPVAINPENPHIAGPQLCCAAAESPLIAEEALIATAPGQQLVESLTTSGDLLQSADGTIWFSPRKYPQRQVSLRGSGSTYAIIDQSGRRLLGEIDGYRALRECHPGAIYLHMAKTYHVDSLDLETGEILVSAVQPSYFTRVLTSKNTAILETNQSVEYGACRIHRGKLQVTEIFSGYHRVAQGSMRILARQPLQLPPLCFTTEGLWLEIPDGIRLRLEQEKHHFMGGIHALEHALIGLMPLFVLCDRNDLGGISHPWHEQTETPAIFIYDGHAGGMGLTAQAFAAIGELLVHTQKAVAACPCDFGCPSCVHSPKCGSGNRPIDKAACLRLLELLLSRQPAAQPCLPPIISPPKQVPDKVTIPACSIPERFGVFDVETQRSAQEVGGWHRANLMRVSVAVLYENAANQFTTFTEDTIENLIDRLFALDFVIGFNSKRFDYKVLSAYTRRSFHTLPSLDILEVITTQLGYRLSLDRLAEKTLKVKKQGDGLLALQWFKEGRWKELTEYCRVDVEITRDLFLFGLKHRHLLFQNKAGQEVRLPVDFVRAVHSLRQQQAEAVTAKPDLYAPNRSNRDGRP